jgi:hypothetical protein
VAACDQPVGQAAALSFSVEGEKILIHHRSVNESSVVDENRVNVIAGIFLKISF